jgi:hypothetical protein
MADLIEYRRSRYVLKHQDPDEKTDYSFASF